MTDSIAKGVFIKWPKNAANFATSMNRQRLTTRSKQAHKDIDNSPSSNVEVLENNGFRKLDLLNEDDELVKLRREKFLKAWKFVETTCNNLILDLNTETFDALTKFVENASKDLTLMNSTYQSISTAIILTGINLIDNNVIFMNLERHLAKRHHVAVLNGAECANIKAMIKSLVEKLQIQYDAYSGEGSKMATTDFRIILAWYLHMKKSTPKAAPVGNIVIVLPEYESFSADILTEFITLCSSYREKIPIVFLFGVATSIQALHDSLPRSCLSVLKMEKFQVQQSRKCFDAIVEEILLKPSLGLKLDEACFQQLLENFELHNLSINSFMKSFKYALMDYYFTNPVSVLMTFSNNVGKNYSDECMEKFNDRTWAQIRMYPTFMVHVKRLAVVRPAEARSVLNNDSELNVKIGALLQNLRECNLRYYAAFLTLLEFQSALPKTFGRPCRTLYLMGLKESLGVSNHVKMLLTTIKKVKRPIFRNILDSICDMFENNPLFSKYVKKEAKQLELLLEEYSTQFCREADVEDSDNETDEQGLNEDIDLEYEAKLLKAGIKTLETTKRTTSVSNRDGSYLSEGLAMDKYQEIVQKITGFFMKFFTDALKHHDDICLSELIYYRNPARMRKAFHPMPRASIQTALGQPSHFLSCTCCSKDTESIDASMQDTTILYKLYLECGKLINLHDLCVAFGNVLESEKIVRDKKRKVSERQSSKVSDVEKAKEIQARFLHAMAELQLMGFVKPTNRKADHVLKLTWGSV
ncbi:Origin recognition complex subunit 3 [Nowakowskiella sp. JEL0407]|nr:Origin recognition complex subunit 3 [Nowakowskiella sp. JEL0407]